MLLDGAEGHHAGASRAVPKSDVELSIKAVVDQVTGMWKCGSKGGQIEFPTTGKVLRLHHREGRELARDICWVSSLI